MYMSNQFKNITEIAGQQAQNLGLLLIEVAYKGDERNRIIEIFVDSSKGVSVDDCAKLSRQIAEVIDAENLITSKYRLDVSSPGVDRPLKYLEQFDKHLNRKFEVVYQENSPAEAPEPVKQKLSGKLIMIQGDILTFRADNKIETDINFNNIITAKVLISF